jgi:SAM-dependent methyltransferase
MPPIVASPDLTALANKFGSDKGDHIGDAHNYARLYSFLFGGFREQPFSMLEIGLQIGIQNQTALANRVSTTAPSVGMWLEFFPRAHIYGVDISDFSALNGLPRFTFFRCDVGSREMLAALKRSTPPLRIVVDDGSHCPYHQQVALSELFEKVTPGGLYIIEDLHWHNREVDPTLPPAPRTEDIFQQYLATGILDSPVFSESTRSFIQAQIANVFVHWDNRGGTDLWTIKMIAIQRK